MAEVLLAIGWDGLIQVALAVIGTLIWAVLHFGFEKKKPNVGQRPQRRPQARPAGNDPLQAEIDEFLRKAQALREGRPEPQAARPQRQAQPAPPRRSQRQRPQTPKQPARPATVPVVVEVVEARAPHESVAEHVAHRMGSKFETRESSMGRMQGEADAEFSKHMERVFSSDIGVIKPAATGIFTPAAIAASPAMTAETSRSATAPTVVRKASSDISVFLASGKNLRDAVILSEILRRPEDRWS